VDTTSVTCRSPSHYCYYISPSLLCRLSFLCGGVAAVGTRTQPGGSRASSDRASGRTNRSHSWRQVVEHYTHAFGRTKEIASVFFLFIYFLLFSRLLPIPCLGMMAAIIAGGKVGGAPLAHHLTVLLDILPIHPAVLHEPPPPPFQLLACARTCVRIYITHEFLHLMCV
jgi:hypothetical protein